jgi:hypothetical protein
MREPECWSLGVMERWETQYSSTPLLRFGVRVIPERRRNAAPEQEFRGYSSPGRIRWPETHRRAQPLRTEARKAKNVRKSPIPGSPAPESTPIGGVFSAVVFRFPEKTACTRILPNDCGGGELLVLVGLDCIYTTTEATQRERRHELHGLSRICEFEFVPIREIRVCLG